MGFWVAKCACRRQFQSNSVTPNLSSNPSNYSLTEYSLDNTVGVGANDPQGRRQLARYMIRNPFSLKKMEYRAQQGMVVYRSLRSALLLKTRY